MTRKTRADKGRPKKPPEERMTNHCITVLLNDDLYTWLVTQAKIEHRTQAAYLRHALQTERERLEKED